MNPSEDLILYDFNPDYMTELEKETAYNEMLEGGEDCV